MAWPLLLFSSAYVVELVWHARLSAGADLCIALAAALALLILPIRHAPFAALVVALWTAARVLELLAAPVCAAALVLSTASLATQGLRARSDDGPRPLRAAHALAWLLCTVFALQPLGHLCGLKGMAATSGRFLNALGIPPLPAAVAGAQAAREE